MFCHLSERGRLKTPVREARLTILYLLSARGLVEVDDVTDTEPVFNDRPQLSTLYMTWIFDFEIPSLCNDGLGSEGSSGMSPS